MNENIYKDMMDQAKPSNILIRETKNKMYAFAEDRSAPQRDSKKRRRLVPVLITAILVVSLATTALAFGEELFTLVFGSSSVKQVEFEEGFMRINSTKGGISIFTRSPSDAPFDDIKDRSVPNLDWTWEEVESWGLLEKTLTEKYVSFDDLSRAAPFAVKEPAYIPSGWEFSQAELFLYRDGTYSYDAYTYYRNSTEYVPLILFAQYYAGADAYFDVLITSDYEHEFIRRTYTHETVMIGDVEALLTIVLSEYDASPQIAKPAGSTRVEIRWIKNEMAYWLIMDENIIDLETYDTSAQDTMIEILKAIAESV